MQETGFLLKKEVPLERWQLKREDDHGNQYLMATFDSKEEAERAMAHYESKGHKQTYWIEKSPSPSLSHQGRGDIIKAEE